MGRGRTFHREVRNSPVNHGAPPSLQAASTWGRGTGGGRGRGRGPGAVPAHPWFDSVTLLRDRFNSRLLATQEGKRGQRQTLVRSPGKR